MTIWDDIYKNYQKGGDAWATIKGDLAPAFFDFIEGNNFKLKSVLDIGCGTGKYMVFLKNLGFKITGLDSSETALEMTRKLLGGNGDVICADMFNFAVPSDKYDLVYSISTIHHGSKEVIARLIEKIYNSLTPGGQIFITLPNIAALNKWETFRNHEDLAPGTYAPLSGPEKGLAHSFFAEEEIKDIFSRFGDLKIKLDETGRWVITGRKKIKLYSDE